MNIDIKEIAKITLEKNEMLWITIAEDRAISQEDFYLFENQVLNIFPIEWRDRIVIGSDKIQLTKIVKGE